MRQFFNFIQQYPFVIYIVIFVGVPMLGRIVKGIKDKRREAERKRMVQRAEMETLRTGRVAGSPDFASQRPAAPQVSYPQPAPSTTYQAPPPPSTARAGQPRYVQLPGGVILELPPAPTGPSAGSGPSQAPRPAAPRPARANPRPAPQRPAPQRPAPARPAPAARTPAPRPQPPQRSQAPRTGVQTTQQTVARRQAAEDQSRAQLQVRDREEREAEERRRQSDERQRVAREEQQRQQTDKIVAEAYRQSAPVAGDRGATSVPVSVGKMKLKTRDLRRVFLLREIMDPPVSMRDER